MWEPRRLTTVWAFTACYRDSSTLPALSVIADNCIFIFVYKRFWSRWKRSLLLRVYWCIGVHERTWTCRLWKASHVVLLSTSYGRFLRGKKAAARIITFCRPTASFHTTSLLSDMSTGCFKSIYSHHWRRRLRNILIRICGDIIIIIIITKLHQCLRLKIYSLFFASQLGNLYASNGFSSLLSISFLL
jgi:hypothetical protein